MSDNYKYKNKWEVQAKIAVITKTVTVHLKYLNQKWVIFLNSKILDSHLMLFIKPPRMSHKNFKIPDLPINIPLKHLLSILNSHLFLLNKMQLLPLKRNSWSLKFLMLPWLSLCKGINSIYRVTAKVRKLIWTVFLKTSRLNQLKTMKFKIKNCVLKPKI